MTMGTFRGHTRGHTHTHMRSTTHHVRSNTPGNNLSFFTFSGVLCIQNSASYECDGPMSPVTTVFFALPVLHRPCSLPACLTPSLWLTRTKRMVMGPSGEFPLCSAPYLLTTHHHQPSQLPTRGTSHLVPRWLRRPDHAHPASNVTRIGPPCHGKCNHRPQINPPSQSQPLDYD